MPAFTLCVLIYTIFFVLDKQYGCDKCRRRFKYASSLHNHKKYTICSGSEAKILTCDHCDFYTRYFNCLKNHLQSKHGFFMDEQMIKILKIKLKERFLQNDLNQTV